MASSADFGTFPAKVENKTSVVSVIGLGYVGLAVACEFARVGFTVIGVDIDRDRVSAINRGECPIEGNEPGLLELLSDVISAGRLRATTDYELLRAADVVLICVDTPVDEDHRPRYHALSSAARALGRVLHNDMLVIVESTVSPGTTNGVVLPILEEQSGLRAGTDFSIGACPERVMPGKLLNNLRTVSRVCGGNTIEVAETMRALYRHVVHAELDVSDVITAELVKTAENAYRDVQIAFANEVALVCEANGADVWKVRTFVNKSPGRHMLLPGAGVGGHCIPKDPWLLAAAAPETSPLRLVPTARAVNDSMPAHVGMLALSGLRAEGVLPEKARVAVLGYSYLENCDDTRNSPSVLLVSHLVEAGVEVTIHDPWVPSLKGSAFDVIRGRDAVIFMVRHDEYLELSLPDIRSALRSAVLVDGRGLFAEEKVRAAGLRYLGVGQRPDVSIDPTRSVIETATSSPNG